MVSELNMVMWKQGIIDCKGTETRQTFSRMFVMAKNKKLFTSTLNGITAARGVSSMTVVVNAKLLD